MESDESSSGPMIISHHLISLSERPVMISALRDGDEGKCGNCGGGRPDIVSIGDRG
jgi:hypothetical protein